MKSRGDQRGAGGRRLGWLVVLAAALALVSSTGAVAASTPSPSRPAARTGAAAAVTYQAADLTGAVDPGGQPTTYFFQYGPTIHYGSQSSPASPAVGHRTLGVRSTITGLVALTQYHYRLVAINASGTAFGGDATLITTAVPLSLAISALPDPVVLGGPLSVVGTLTGTGAASSVVVLQHSPFPFDGGFQVIGSPGLTSPSGGFQFDLPSLTVTTQFRVVSVGPGEPVVSPTVTEFVHLAVTMSVLPRPAGRRPGNRVFSGLIRPAQTGARVSLQRLFHGRWVLVAATAAHAAPAGASTYALALGLRHSGLYRAFAASVEGGHLASVSDPLVVHVSR